MKQHITVEQFKELDIEQKEKIKKIMNLKERDDILLWCNGKEKYSGEVWCWEGEKFPLLSIGQMIEFLMKNTNGRVKDLEDKVDKVAGWVSKFAFGKTDSPVIIAWKEEELCDALWKSVKEVLKKIK